MTVTVHFPKSNPVSSSRPVFAAQRPPPSTAIARPTPPDAGGRPTAPAARRSAQIPKRPELRIEQPQPEALPELPDFLTGHIDPLTGLDNSGDGDGSELRPELFGSLAGSPRAAFGPGGANPNNPFANLDISRNAPCPCGSGNKYKHCHGAVGAPQNI